MTARPITTATDTRPCPHCQGTSWCFSLDGGARGCYRATEGGQPRTDKQGQPYRLFLAEGATKRTRTRTAEWEYVSPVGEPVLRVTRYDTPRGKTYTQASYTGGT